MLLPKEVQYIIKKLEQAGFEAYAVGGCVRDFLLGVKAKDWDITTSALPEQIQKLFPKSVYLNKFGTVTIYEIVGKKSAVGPIEVTTYRLDEKYSDQRHPDSVKFTRNLNEDLARRDFTINAMALKLSIVNRRPTSVIIDPLGGQKDLKNKIIRAVGEPEKRFKEDALRLMRAIRFAATLNYEIEPKTWQAIKKAAFLIKRISIERIRDELIKIISSKQPAEGIEKLKEANLLKHILPELELGIGVDQNKHHIYTIYKHSILSLKYCPSQDYRVRLAALFHDIAKPQTKQGEGPDATFYNHDIVGARISQKIMRRLNFSREDIDRVSLLIRYHMFYYDVEVVGEAGVRRLIRKVGLENIKDLVDLRIADRLGSGVPKAKPYKLRHFEYVVEKVGHDPISVKMLKINGHQLMTILKIKPGPKVGAILDVLLAEVIDEPKKNDPIHLKKRIVELNKLDLNELRQRAKEKIKITQEDMDTEIKGKYYVK
ncbi:MAG: HD domain-containing protein [bacterium]